MSDFALVDFSPDGSSILLHGTITRSFPDEALRYIQIGLLEVSSGEIQWHDVWDLFQWKDCDALVEPQGFTRDGKVAVVARESVFSAPRRANCVSGGPPHQGPGPSARGLYVLDVKSKSAGAAPVEVQVERYGKVVRPAVQACQSDPDIVDACFKVRARLRAYNGAPTLRIWEVGTKRVFGVSSRDSVIPESLALAEGASYFDFEAFADFLLCPFSRPQPGEMQLVCVQSATGVKIKRQ